MCGVGAFSTIIGPRTGGLLDYRIQFLDRVFDLGIARLLSLPVRAGIHTCTGIAASVIALVPLWTTF